ncbi:pali-domain-containing protein [Mycena latifolia]|nr:pali-domain-containing protein [Mycena latifolia]
MSPRSLYFAGIACLAIACIFLVLASISLPLFSGLDFVRVTFPNAQPGEMSQLRLGLWAPCSYDGSGQRICVLGGHGYSFRIFSSDEKQSVLIGSSYTRGLAIHPVAAVFTGAALGVSFLQSDNAPVIAMLISFVAAFLTALAFIVDIALLAFVKQQIGNLANTNPGSTTASSAFWLTFISLILILVSGFTVCFGRRKDVSASYPNLSSSGGGILARFRKN